MNAQSIDRGFRFGPFQLYPWQRLLMEGDRPIKLGSRALEILTVLVENAGEIVGKAQLMKRVWPHNVVEEAALRVHMAALRKILGDGRARRRFIVTVPQRGYSFVAPVHPHPTVHSSTYAFEAHQGSATTASVTMASVTDYVPVPAQEIPAAGTRP